jgi:hypothetical protein
LIAYSINLAHSILPHQHFSSIKEYQQTVNEPHQEEDQQHGHEENHGNGHAGQELPINLFFLTHAPNIDFSLSKFSFEQKFKVTIQQPDFLANNVLLSYKYVAESLFPIPDLPLRIDCPTLSSRSLRAPPII